jgi:hypothetical protein
VGRKYYLRIFSILKQVEIFNVIRKISRCIDYIFITSHINSLTFPLRYWIRVYIYIYIPLKYHRLSIFPFNNSALPTDQSNVCSQQALISKQKFLVLCDCTPLAFLLQYKQSYRTHCHTYDFCVALYVAVLCSTLILSSIFVSVFSFSLPFSVTYPLPLTPFPVLQNLFVIYYFFIILRIMLLDIHGSVRHSMTQ